jgi:thiosulfate/3-mercaptopyruvate sulfurtransferase
LPRIQAFRSQLQNFQKCRLNTGLKSVCINTKRVGSGHNPRMSPTFHTLITVEQLSALQASGAPVMVFDCSFDLSNPKAGRAQYAEGHIPGAHYVHLDEHLSEKRPGYPTASGGRHPLPERAAFAAWLGSIGLTPQTQAVVYDRQGCNYCGRLWWMLQWVGHEAAAVLDGGLAAWSATQPLVQAAPPMLCASNYTPGPERRPLAATEIIANQLGRPGLTVLDARAAPRFRGDVEPLDPVAGHIPGALNRPFGLNLGADGKFKPAAQLRQEFDALLAGRDPAGVVHHCGSGVSAVPNVLAMAIAGFAPTALYAGSWSEWCADPARPVARG